MAIFNSYVKLPEGRWLWNHIKSAHKDLKSQDLHFIRLQFDGQH